MKKLILFIFIALFIILVALIFQEVSKPKPFVWQSTFQSYDKNPYGAFVLFNQLPNFFPGKKVKRLVNDDLTVYYSYSPLFENMRDANVDYADYNYDELVDSTNIASEPMDSSNLEPDSLVSFDNLIDTDTSYNEEFIDYFDPERFLSEMDAYGVKKFNLFIINYNFDLLEAETRVLLQHAFQGNDVLISSFTLTGPMAYYLKVYPTHFSDTTSLDSLDERFTVTFKKGQSLKLAAANVYSFIRTYPVDAEILMKNELGEALAVRVKIGKGSVTYFSMPIFMTNYYLLKDKSEAADFVLKSLPVQNTYWANYFEGEVTYQPSRSIMEFIHSQASLSWAFYTLLVSVLIFLAFQIRREQRPIPIIHPKENVSLKFTETISNLYLLNSSHQEMAKKKMALFLETVRVRYNLDTSVIDQRFIQHLATKANVKETLVKLIFERYNKMMTASSIDEDDFVSFSNLLQNFKHPKI